jgi:hypothetical protein
MFTRSMTIVTDFFTKRNSQLKRTRAQQWQRASVIARMTLFEKLDFNLASGRMVLAI